MSEKLPAVLAAALSDRYALERELGRGGNAVVYLAHDVKHDRKVALKVLLPELALAVRAERFLREIQIAARLTHPHILPLYDSGEVDGILYYVMPFVEGESLRERLNRERQLPVDDAIRITCDVAAALAEAHRREVVHRDIKPENILLTPGGEAVVADFGIARALTIAGGQTVTESGVAVGTPAYMSPEQASGGTVDARSDLYSLGCVLYEMLVGHPPFTGGTAQEVLSRHVLDPVPTLRAARTAISPRVEQAIQRALAKQPADRFAAAAEFTAAIAGPGAPPLPPERLSIRRWLVPAVAGGLLLLAAVGFATRARWFGPAAAGATDRAVAVLPCSGLSTSPEGAYLSEWVAEELITALNRVPGLRVPGRGSTFSLEGPNKVDEAARTLGVSHAIECTVREASGQLSIGARLVDARGNQVWGETFRGPAADQFGLQERVAQAVVARLQRELPLGASPGSLVRRSTENRQALELYQRGRYFFHRRTPNDMRKALADFEQAVRLDSGFAQAFSGLSDIFGLSATGRNYVPIARDSAWRLAKTYALRAVELDSTLAEAWTSLARVRYTYDWDFPAAETAFKNAIRLDPHYAFGHQRYGLFLSWVMSPVGRCPEAIREARLAQELEPLLPGTNTVVGNALRFCGQPQQAIEYYRRSTRLEPGISENYSYIALALIAMREYQDALVELDSGSAVGGSYVLLRAFIDAPMGKTETSTRLIQTLKQELARGEPNSRDLATVYLGLGEVDSAFAWLSRAIETRDFPAGPSLGGLFGELKSDPRYDALLKKAGLKQ